jgi:hypothetical protein
MPLQTPKPLTTADLTAMNNLLNQNTIQGVVGYYDYLAGKGYDYGKLAKGVVLDNTPSGSVARNYAENVACFTGKPLTDQKWDAIAKEMAKADLDARQKAFNAGRSTDIDVDQIRRYHEVVFKNVADLPIDAWTAHAPTSVGWNTLAERQAAWEYMLEGAISGGITEFEHTLGTLGSAVANIPDLTLDEMQTFGFWFSALNAGTFYGVVRAPGISIGGALTTCLPFLSPAANYLLDAASRLFGSSYISPIIVDMDGDGIAERTGWLKGDDAFVVCYINLQRKAVFCF